MTACSMCQTNRAPEELTDGICMECRQTSAIGFRTAPPRPRVPCARCKHSEFVRARLREQSTRYGDVASPKAVPAAVTFGFQRTQDYFGKASEPDFDLPIGLIEAFICRGCGFTEFYTQRPADIPIGEAYATERFDVKSEGPYR